MSSPGKIREDLEEIKSELGGMGEKLTTSANEGNWHKGSISILVFQAMKFQSFAFEPNWAIRPELVPLFFETARNFSTTPWMGGESIVCLPLALKLIRWYPCLHLGGMKHIECNAVTAAGALARNSRSRVHSTNH